MPDLVKFGFSGGVFSPKLFMRSDLKKFDLGLAFARNFFVEYTGGASTRPGTEFIDYIQDDDEPARIVQFEFNRAISNTYAILFAKNRIRFLQDGAYVLETGKNILVGSTGTTVQVTAHGYSIGDWVKIQGNTYEVATVAANSFTITSPGGASIDTSLMIGYEVGRIYTLASPYDTADLRDLTFSQYRDELYINSTSYTEKKLTRLAAASWTLTDISYDVNGNVPTGLTLTPSAAGTYGAVFAVTMVDQQGRESYIGGSAIALNRLCVNYATTAGHMGLTWTAPAAGEIAYYKIYRSLLMLGTELHYGLQLGYLGQTTFPKFTDSNIVPDFTHTPPEINLPIVGGQMPILTVSAGGAGYTDASVITPSGGGGSAWSGKPIVQAGAITGVRVLNPGFGYSGSPVSFTATVGAGATIVSTPTPLNGNDPAASAMIQQRRVRVGTENYPGTLFGSRIGEPDNYYSSGQDLATDPFALTLDSEQLTPVKFIVPYPEGAFIFQDTAITQVRGLDDGIIKVGAVKAQELTEDGSSNLPPLKIKRDFLYLNAAKTSVYALGPTNLPQYYVPNDISVYSEHYFSGDNPIVSWTWAKSPNKILWAARKDGSFLSLTYVSEQEVAAWCEHSTPGVVEDIESVLEDNIDRVYMIVKRLIDGTFVRYIERMALSNVTSPDDVWPVDCGIRTAKTHRSVSVRAAILSDTNVKLFSLGGVAFVAGDVGKLVRLGEARGTLTTFTSSTQATLTMDRPFDPDVADISTLPYRVFAPGEWTIDDYVNTVSNIDHLNGEFVEVLGDGVDLGPEFAFGGQITLTTAATYVTVGLPFTAKLKTLPMTASDAVIEGKYKAPKALAVRLWNTTGAKFGDGAGDVMFPISAPQGDAPLAGELFHNGMREISIAASMTLDGQITVEKTGLQHITVLGYVAEVEIGD